MPYEIKMDALNRVLQQLKGTSDTPTGKITLLIPPTKSVTDVARMMA